MGILQELEELRNKIAIMQGWKGHPDRMSAEEWEERYWIQVRTMNDYTKNMSEKFEAFAHEVFRARNLQELNTQQASRIMELELLLSCIRRVGDGVHIEHKRMQETYHLLPNLKQFIHDAEPNGLSSSKYVRK